MLVFVGQQLVWTMDIVVVCLSMDTCTQKDKGGLILDMVIAAVPSLDRSPLGYMGSHYGMGYGGSVGGDIGGVYSSSYGSNYLVMWS